MTPLPYGLMAEFTTPEALIAAAQSATAQGYTRMDAYTPFPVEGLSRALGKKRNWLPLVFLLGGILGGSGGYFMEWYSMAVDYPLNIGGRPFHSWPSFIPVTFELTVLIAALSGVLGLFVSIKLPRPHHPIFNAPDFQRATDNRFFLCLEQDDPKFSLETARRFLHELKPVRIVEVPQ
ncbi:MAG: DUF3341 domain-containing protein [Verrucomicrobia bacterium]|nr:DUF3341 domain-containing protein [Verrucomicrobiota bacterium]